MRSRLGSPVALTLVVLVGLLLVAGIVGRADDSAATSAGVSSASGAGADWTVRLADMVATPYLELPPIETGFSRRS